MTEDYYDGGQYDSEGGEFEKPKDEFFFFYKAFKTEEKKFYNHPRFEEMTAKYWQLLTNDADHDNGSSYISQKLYTKFMKSVYKYLLPLYRDDEMSSEIASEWYMDSNGLQGLNFQQLSKLLFRIAHQWAVNIDLEEYLALLDTIYNRIILKPYTFPSTLGYAQLIITVQFPLDEKKLLEQGGKVEKSAKYDDWLECRSDESNKSDYDYRYEEDPENMTVKKYKKVRNDLSNMGSSTNQGATIKEPFIFTEEASFNYQFGDNTYLTQDKLKAFNLVKPQGYYAEMFLTSLKNQVYQSISASAELNKQEIARLKREMREQNKEIDLSKYAVDVDNGMKEETASNEIETVDSNYDTVYMNDGYSASTQQEVKLSPKLYNNFRRMLRDASTLSIRMLQEFPKVGAKSKPRSQIQIGEPIIEINKFGYNPALERKIFYKLTQLNNYSYDKTLHYMNVYYLESSSLVDAHYRSDVQRVETKDKMAIKESEELKKEEDFINVETSYKKVRQIMLSKKFGSIYQDRSQSDNKELKRLKKIVDRDEKRLADVYKHVHIAQKGVSETYEDKNIIKMMKGPYYQLESQNKREDTFINIATTDLIDAANTKAHRILILGKPRSGKTTLAKNLSIKLDLVHISVDIWIKKLLEKIKTHEPPELEEGQEEPKWLTELEEAVNYQIMNGQGPSQDQITLILRLQISSPEAQTKGYILDLPFAQRTESWNTTLRENRLLGVNPDGDTVQFSHVIELLLEDEEIRERTKNLKVDPKDGQVYSQWDIEQRKKPKPVVDEDAEQAEEDENAIKPLDEKSLVQRICDTEDRIKDELNYYNTIERQAMEEIIVNLDFNQYIRVDSAGLMPDDILSISVSRITPDQDIPLRPKASQIENASDFKSLLTEGLEENAIPRMWSKWKLIDPVALYNLKVIQGLPEFAASYHNYAFVFSTEENMKAFLLEPKLYISSPPIMPQTYRILMLGPKGAGKHTQAQLLQDFYGWTIVDYKELIRNKIEEMRSIETHIPNNPMPGGRIGMSEQEMQEIIEGKAFPSWKFIPWIFDYLGYSLEKKKPPPPEPKDEEEKQEEEEIPEDVKKKKALEEKKKKEEEEKKRKEEEEIQRQKEERRKRRQEAIEQGLDLVELGLENEEEEIVIIEDLQIDQLALKVDEVTQKAPVVGGFILIGFPETEEQFNKLKEYQIEFDKVLYLSDSVPEEEPGLDQTEEEPGAEIKRRMKDVELYDFEQEIGFAEKMLNLAKEQLGEDVVKEINCRGKVEEVFIKIKKKIDPFFLKMDNPDDNRTSADLGEEDKKLPKSDYGDYCPVTYNNDGWLFKGTSEFEVLVENKTYWLAGEKEKNLFTLNPSTFIPDNCPLRPPPPKIMILGQKGSGVSTQIRMLCDKYKLEEFNLKEEFFKKLAEEKEIRKRRRRLERGFKPLPVVEAGDEDQPPPVDEEIENDPEDFDKAQHEREVLKKILVSSKGLVIDGTWADVEEGTINQTLAELLFESRRVPEIVIMFKCKEKSLMLRPTIKQRLDNIQQEFEIKMEELAKKRKQRREEDREAKVKELSQDEEKTAEEKEEEMKKWDEDRDAQDEADDENDPDKPNIETMREDYLNELRTRREKDDAFMDEFGQTLKDKGVFVIDDIKTDISAEYVFLKVLDRIKDNFQFRNDLIERQLAQPLKPEEVKFFEKSYIYKHSKYGINSPISISNPSKTKKNAVLYRERLYFLTNPQQQLDFLKEPSKYVDSNQYPTIPLDLIIKPKIFVLGQSKVGKSTLCKQLSEKTGIVHLHMTKIIQSFLDKESLRCEQLRKVVQQEGRQLNDETLVQFLLERIQFADCYNNGFILEDFPKTRTQAVLLAKRGLAPTNIFYLKAPLDVVNNRNQERPAEKFGRDPKILQSRVQLNLQQHPNLLSFYRRYYNNVCDIDMTKSKWYVYDRAFKEIQSTMEARQQFGSQGPSRKVKNMHMDRNLCKQSLSKFKYFCPVTWRNEKLLYHCSENFEDCVLHSHFYFYFKSSKERDMFISNPDRFLIESNFPSKEDLPQRMKPHKAAEVVLLEKALNGYCPVTLMDEERVVKGDPILLVYFREQKFVFQSEFKLQKFFSNPYKYSKASLPVKMPPNEDKISLYNLSKMDDSITFMEQALGQIVTRALREVSENRLKYPTLSVKETMLKLFALFLKTNNPANTEFMKKKYQGKMKDFIQKCELPEEIFELGKEKEKKKQTQGGWSEFKENYYNNLGKNYDDLKVSVEQEKQENFMSYIR